MYIPPHYKNVKIDIKNNCLTDYNVQQSVNSKTYVLQYKTTPQCHKHNKIWR